MRHISTLYPAEGNNSLSIALRFSSWTPPRCFIFTVLHRPYPSLGLCIGSSYQHLSVHRKKRKKKKTKYNQRQQSHGVSRGKQVVLDKHWPSVLICCSAILSHAESILFTISPGVSNTTAHAVSHSLRIKVAELGLHDLSTLHIGLPQKPARFALFPLHRHDWGSSKVMHWCN